MTTQDGNKSLNEPRLSLHRIYIKNSSFESFSVNMASLKNAVQPMVEMQVFANVYAQENNTHQAVLGLKIEAKHNGDLMWRLNLETAGFYTLEGFNEEQQQDALNGYCMNQLYSHAAVIITQIITQGGFSVFYLQPMDFNRLYQDKKKETFSKEEPKTSEVLSKRLNAIKDMNFAEPLIN